MNFELKATKKPKEQMLTVKIDKALLDEVRIICKRKGLTMTECLRQYFKFLVKAERGSKNEN